MSSINGTWHLRTVVLTLAAIGLATARTGCSKDGFAFHTEP
jgi:hypothetical protein